MTTSSLRFRTLAVAGISALALACSAQGRIALVPPTEAKTSTFSLLYTFTGGDDGATPLSGLIADKSGNLYGTAWGGGVDNLGTMYQLATDGTQTPLITFDGANGQSPCYGYLLLDKSGNFFGTTGDGGDEGYGAVYTLAAGTEQVLHSFSMGSDGWLLYYELVQDKNGNLYGNAYEGGANGFGGEVYEVMPDGTETALYSFCSHANCTDGLYPDSQLITDKHENLYGTTVEGGSAGWGTVFELSPPAKGQNQWTETVLHAFTGGTSDGLYPRAGVIADKSGNLYGTAEEGGPNMDGIVYKIAPDGAFSLLYTFLGGNDGAKPWAPLIVDKDGNLYGTTTEGGAENDGTVFKVAPNGGETILYSFTGGSDGANPYSPLHRKGSWLYGTASAGGADGHGTVFKVKD